MNVILFDDPAIRVDLLPFTFTRPVGAIRVGILTIAEKWDKWLAAPTSFRTESYIEQKFKRIQTTDNLHINGAICPDPKRVDTLKALPEGYFLVHGNLLVAARNPGEEMNSQNTVEYPADITVMDKPWKIFRENATQIRLDFKLITAGRTSAPITDKHTIAYNPE